MIQYNLQFFAKEGMGGEKTEPATQKTLSYTHMTLPTTPYV